MTHCYFYNTNVIYILHKVYYKLQKAIYSWKGDGSLAKNKNVKLARIEKDLTQEELANKVGVTRQTIGLIEAGKYNPTINLCIAICKVLDKTLNDLFWEGVE